MTIDGQIIKRGKKSGDADQLIFKDGKFTSTACVKYGFEAVPYKSFTEGEKTTFEAKATNKDGETMAWRGSLLKGKLTAKAVYTNAKKKNTEYVFKEALKK